MLTLAQEHSTKTQITQEEALKAALLLADSRLKQGELYRVQILLLQAQAQLQESNGKYLSNFNELKAKYSADGCQLSIETRMWTCVQKPPQKEVVPSVNRKSSNMKNEHETQQESKEVKKETEK